MTLNFTHHDVTNLYYDKQWLARLKNLYAAYIGVDAEGNLDFELCPRRAAQRFVYFITSQVDYSCKHSEQDFSDCDQLGLRFVQYCETL